jgi:hypothetical protein
MLQEGVLYKFGQDNMFCQVLHPEHVSKVLQELHGGVVGGYFSFDIIVKILNASY